ncbi:hypothetical protein DENSPDRAFT_854327 [Dentipellis sp. KUC8613]|nr:hypothetical protein DENSPDRAFT_854327 [Dentipellis sp. KUC8613]
MPSASTFTGAGGDLFLAGDCQVSVDEFCKNFKALLDRVTEVAPERAQPIERSSGGYSHLPSPTAAEDPRSEDTPRRLFTPLPTATGGPASHLALPSSLLFSQDAHDSHSVVALRQDRANELLDHLVLDQLSRLAPLSFGAYNNACPMSDRPQIELIRKERRSSASDTQADAAGTRPSEEYTALDFQIASMLPVLHSLHKMQVVTDIRLVELQDDIIQLRRQMNDIVRIRGAENVASSSTEVGTPGGGERQIVNSWAVTDNVLNIINYIVDLILGRWWMREM